MKTLFIIRGDTLYQEPRTFAWETEVSDEPHIYDDLLYLEVYE